MFRVEISNKVMKYLKKLNSKERKYFERRIDDLENSKKGYRLLDQKGNIELWELRCSAHRVYYIVEDKEIFIEEIIYEGNISVLLASNKNAQRKVIDRIKDLYLRDVEEGYVADFLY